VSIGSMPMAVSYLIVYLILRLSLTWTTGKWGIGDRQLPKILWLIPVRDAISFIIWITGFFSDRIIWRGLRYHIKSGQLIPIPSSSYGPAPRPESISSVAS
jgi:ceramide glucosyltransferase